MATPKKPAAAKPASAAAKSAAKPKPKTAPTKPKAEPKAKSKSKESDPAIYTDPKLRDRLKDEITAGDKGGKPGQWSARKAQLLASEYEKAGGDYKNGKQKKTKSQEHLDSWTDEDWKTSDGKPADRDGGTTRYLPAEAWDKLTPAQKKATNTKKQAGSKHGEQHVANTTDAKKARKSATKASAPAKAAADKKEEPKPKPKAKPKAKSSKKTAD